MNPIYSDGQYHYIIVNENGKYKKIHTDETGNPIQGSTPYIYKDTNDLTSDVSNMWELLPQDVSTPQSTISGPATSNYDSPTFNTQIEPDFVQGIGKGLKKIGQGVSNMFEQNPYSSIYSDEKARIKNRRADLKDMRQQNVAERRETAKQRREDILDARINRKADQNIFLKEKQKELGKTRKYNRLAKEIKSMGKLEDKILKMKSKHATKRAKLGDISPLPGFMEDDKILEAETDQFKEGGIYIKPSKRGTFTTAAKKRGLGVQAFANQVMSNKDGYSPAMVKKANFAKNAAGWKKQEGGPLDPYSDMNQQYIQEQSDLYDVDQLQNTFNTAKVNQPTQLGYGQLDDSFGNLVRPKGRTFQPTNQQTTSDEWQYDPRKLTKYGNQLSERALNRTAGFNMARYISDEGYKNPKIMPDFKYRQQYDNPNFTPIHETFHAGEQGLKSNLRSTAGLVGNLLQSNANKVRAMMQEATRSKQSQRGLDAQFMGQQQQYENMDAQERRRLEQLRRADHAAKEQYLKGTMEQWERADQQRAKLYNAELGDYNQIQNYVNQLSPEYKAVPQADGTIKIVFKSTGKEVPEAQVNQKIVEKDTSTTGTAAGVSSKKTGGKIKSGQYITKKPTKKKRVRYNLY